MKIERQIISKIERDYFFIEASLNLDSSYFVSKINEGISVQNNLNYKTNVKGKHTSWEFFNEDQEFLKHLFMLFDHLDTIKNIRSYYLGEAWGVKEDYGDYTREHDHLPCFLSGIIYLNKHSQKLYIPEIKKEIIPEPGKLIIFSSSLKHYTKRNLTNESKYAIAFNLKYNTIGSN
tara:strand:+ start:82 stop:609 length:528 start_codon:yes stop_codon:yes gene_type:complete